MGWNLPNENPRFRTKWLSFVAAIWLMAFVGTEDAFPFYSPALQAALSYDDLQLSALSAAKDTGKGFGLIAGVLSFLVPLWVILAISIVEGILGFGFLGLVVAGKLNAPPFKLMYVVLWMVGNSITWSNTAAIVVSIQNFPFNRGTVVGILKGIQALSAAMYIQLGSTIFDGSIGSFLFLLGSFPAISCLVGIVLLQRVPPVMSRKEAHEDKKNFTFVYISTVLLALYMLSFNISKSFTSISSLMSSIYIIGLIIFFIAPIILPIRSFVCSCFVISTELGDAPTPRGQITDPLLQSTVENSTESVPLVADSYTVESLWMHAVTQANQTSEISTKKLDEMSTTLNQGNTVPSSSSTDDIVSEEQALTMGSESTAPNPRRVLKKLGTHHFTVKDAWGAKEFWLLFFSFFCGIGMSITLQLNLSEISQAFGYNDVSIFSTIFTVSTFFGMILGGGASEFLIRLAAIPRPFFAGLVEVVMVICYAQLGLGFPGAPFIGTFFAGITAGVQMTIAIATASELFGLKYIGMLYNFLLLVYPLAGKLFSGMIVAKLYDYEAHKVGAAADLGVNMVNLTEWREAHHFLPLYAFLGDTESCIGAHCFRYAFFIMSFVSAIGVCLNLALLFRVRRLYRSWYWNESLLAHAEDVPPAPLLITVS